MGSRELLFNSSIKGDLVDCNYVNKEWIYNTINKLFSNTWIGAKMVLYVWNSYQMVGVRVDGFLSNRKLEMKYYQRKIWNDGLY